MAYDQTGIILGTALATFVGGFILGVWSIQGYIISPSLVEERRRNLNDPIESEESDVSESETLLDHAPNWANGAGADRRQGLTAQQSWEKSGLQDNDEECKLVLVVRTDLGMTKGILFFHPISSHTLLILGYTNTIAGKIAAQCSHATLACYKTLSRLPASSAERRVLARWEKSGQAKIAVQIKSEDELLELRLKARNMGLCAEVIQDAGRTQIEAGSMTVLGVGPAPRSLVDQITGHLKLL